MLRSLWKFKSYLLVVTISTWTLSSTVIAAPPPTDDDVITEPVVVPTAVPTKKPKSMPSPKPLQTPSPKVESPVKTETPTENKKGEKTVQLLLGVAYINSTPVSVSGFANNNGFGPNPSVGYGAFLNFKIHGPWGIGAGVMYQARAFTDPVGNTVTLNFIRPGVNISYAFPITSRFSISLAAGPWFGYGVGNITENGQSYSFPGAPDFSFNHWDYGLTENLNFNYLLFPAAKITAVLSARYSEGLQDMSANPNNSISFNDFNIFVGAKFPVW